MPRGCALTIGNFDGVHLGHQLLLQLVVEAARSRGAAAAAITFEPHPIRVLAPARAPKLLTAFPGRAQLIAARGIEVLLALPFTRELAHLTPAQFVDDIVIGQMRAVSVCIGPNFRFGYRQSGDAQTLADLCREREIAFEMVPAVKARGETVSSTRIRRLLEAGHVHQAGRLLGRPFTNSGAIIAGHGEGRHVTVPTLNLKPDEEEIPKTGVYVTEAQVGCERRRSVTNIGYRPTFGDHPLGIETFLLDFHGTVSETALRIHYLHRLRDEMKFSSPAVLKLQIEEDARRSLRFFRLWDRLSRKSGGST